MMNMVTTMAGRFVVIDKGRLPLPAKCWACGAGDRDCIDWGADIHFQGAVLLCTICVSEAASLLQPAEDLEKTELKAQLAEVTNLLESFHASVSDTIGKFTSGIAGVGLGVSPDVANGTSLRKDIGLKKAV